MPPLSKTLRFHAPLRHARLADATPSSSPAEPGRADREQAAYERGRRDAEKALQAQLVQQRADLAQLQHGVLASLRQVLPQVARECESALVELALESARKLVADLPVSSEMVEAGIRQALAEVEETTGFTVKLHAQDLELLRQAQSEVLGTPESSQPVRFEPSPEVSRGGCMVVTRFGVIDARRETKFELLKKSLRT